MITYRKPFNTMEEVGHIDRLRNLQRLDMRKTKIGKIGDGKNHKLDEYC